MKLYDDFKNGVNLPVNDMLGMLNSVYDFIEDYNDARVTEIEAFEKRMEPVTSYHEQLYFEFTVYKDRVSNELYMQKSFEELYSEVWVHDTWVHVTCVQIMVDKYIETEISNQ